MDAVLRGLTRNPSAPPDVLLRLTAAAIDRSELARRGDLPATAAAVLASDPDAAVRRELAWRNPGLPAEVQAVLAVDADWRVRAGLAEEKYIRSWLDAHGRRFPEPLTREACELLARDPDRRVRRALAFHWQLPDDLRATMLDDADPGTAHIAATEWNPLPAGRIGELLTRFTDAGDRATFLSHLDGPLPAQSARDLLAGIDPAADDWLSTRLLEQVAEVADLDADLTSRFLASPGTRAAVAANPTLSARHVADLARDADNQVRAAVAARPDLDPVLRESIAVDYDERSSAVVGWLRGDLPGPDRLAFARSRHQIFRKTLAMRPDLSDEIVEILARDESFAVRLIASERQPNAPGWLLAQTVAHWTSHTRWGMVAHKNFPADAATGLARSGEDADRMAAAAHPGLAADVIESLLTDHHDTVRGRAAANPAIPVTRLTELLADADPAVAEGAAANRMLPAAAMRLVLDHAGLLRHWLHLVVAG